MQFKCNTNDFWVNVRSPYFSFRSLSQSTEMEFASLKNLSVKDFRLQTKIAELVEWKSIQG